MTYATPTPSRQHFPQCGQMRHVDSRYCNAALRSEISSPAPFSGIESRNSSIMGFITAQLHILRPNASGARFTKARDNTSSRMVPPRSGTGKLAHCACGTQARTPIYQRISTPQTGELNQISRVPFHQPRAKAPRCCNPVPAAGVRLIRSAPFGSGNLLRQASVKHFKQSHCIGDAA